jgi:hypothetical protein
MSMSQDSMNIGRDTSSLQSAFLLMSLCLFCMDKGALDQHGASYVCHNCENGCKIHNLASGVCKVMIGLKLVKTTKEEVTSNQEDH